MKRKSFLYGAAVLVLITAVLVGSCSCGTRKDVDIAESSAFFTEPSETEGITEKTVAATTERQTSLPESAEKTTEDDTGSPAQTLPAFSARNESAAAYSETGGVETVTDGSKTVVYPAELSKTNKRFPVIVWANGTGCPTRLYIKLLEQLAGGGYIVIADSDVMTADGATQTDSIDRIIALSKDPESVFIIKSIRTG